jgi:putative ABC transport system permease protein
LPLDREAFAAPVTIVVRTASDPGPLLPAVSALVRGQDPSLPIDSLQTMDQRLDARARAGGRIVARFFLVCGGLGLFLAIVGLAGSVSYSVRQRTRELGIRAAIGAAPRDLGRLVIGGTLRLSAAGIAAGAAAALGLSRLVRAGVAGLDLDSPMTFVLVALLLALVTVAAAAVPGRRAARVDPLDALRAE